MSPEWWTGRQEVGIDAHLAVRSTRRRPGDYEVNCPAASRGAGTHFDSRKKPSGE
jgi:hypothetical protein